MYCTVRAIPGTMFSRFPAVAFDWPNQVDPSYTVRYYWRKTQQTSPPIDLFIQVSQDKSKVARA